MCTEFAAFGLSGGFLLFADDYVCFFFLAGDAEDGLFGVEAFTVDLLEGLLGVVKQIQPELVVTEAFYVEFGEELVLFWVELAFLGLVERHHAAGCFIHTVTFAFSIEGHAFCGGEGEDEGIGVDFC